MMVATRFRATPWSMVAVVAAGYTVGRVTTSFDLSLGVANRSNPNLYGLIGMSLQYRLF